MAFVALTGFLWRTLVRRSTTTGEPFRIFSRRLMVSAGVLSAASSLLLMLMVIGNTESAIAPLTLTVIYG